MHTATPRKPHVIVADDAEAMRSLIADWLAKDGMHVSPVANGHELRALVEALARKGSPPADVILCDVVMPGLDGLAALRALKPLLSRTSVIVMTGFATELTRQEARALGVFAVLEKPFEMSALRVAVNTLVAAT